MLRPHYPRHPLSNTLGEHQNWSRRTRERKFCMKTEKNKQDATIRCFLSTSVSTCFGHHYAHPQENKDRVTAFRVLFCFCWMWLVAVVGCFLVECEHCGGFCLTLSSYFAHDARSQEPKGSFVTLAGDRTTIPRSSIPYSSHYTDRAIPLPFFYYSNV